MSKNEDAFPGGTISDDDCHVCRKAIAFNPRLCNSCQDWNDAMHVIECTKPVYHDGFDVQEGPRSVSLQKMLEVSQCLICSAVANAVCEVRGSSANGSHASASNLRVRNCGPYLRRHDNTFGKDLLYDIHKTVRRSTTIECIVFILVNTDPEGFLHRHKIPQLAGNWMTSAQAFSRRVTQKQSDFGRDLPWPAESIIELQLELHYRSAGIDLQGVRRWNIPPFLDSGRLEKLLSTCEETHSGPCQTPSGPSPVGWRGRPCSICEKTHSGPCDPPLRQMPSGFRLINCKDLCVVEPVDEPRFIALSYAWLDLASGPMEMLYKENLKKLCQRGAIHESSVPAFIWDAITLCRDLGERYLWVDRLCIVQDEKASKKAQIKAMDKIYRGAFATIVAIADQSLDLGLPGVRGRPRRTNAANTGRNFSTDVRIITHNDDLIIDGSRWNTRGWTLQERLLSRRCIFISNYETHFICNKSRYREDLDYDVGPSGSWTKLSLWSISGFHHYCALVERYTARQLSRPDDILDALAGLGNVVSDQLETKLLFNLPERFLAQALFWAPLENMAHREQVFDIPSWSWASWEGAVRFNSVFSDGDIDSAVGTLVRFHVVVKDGIMRAVDVEENWFDVDHDFLELEDGGRLPKVRNIDFQMPISPTDLWRECLHNPWRVFSHSVLDEEGVRTPKKHVGALVFNPTVALLKIGGPLQNGNIDAEKGLTLHNPIGEVVGYVMMMKQDWTTTWFLPAQGRVEAIVVCAGSYPRVLSTEENRIQYFWREEERPYGYVLRVILVQRDEKEPSICRRVAVGCVEVQLWNSCDPKWETVILL